MTVSPAPIAVAFLYIDGAHQVLHSAPAAAELSRDPRFRVDCLCIGDEERAMAERVARAWPEARLTVEQLTLPRWMRAVCDAVQPEKPAKRPYLIRHIGRLMRYDAIVMVERALTLPRRLGIGPRMIYIPHGAGDRAYGFSPRARYFDYVLVSGRKDAERMIEGNLVRPDKCAVSGSIKLGAIDRLRRDRPPFFDNGRPTILYNPHFAPDLSSWPRWGRDIVARFAAQEEFNLVVAPHVQLFKPASTATRAEIEALAIPGRIRIDLGSLDSLDMSYTDAADIYLGDVSSQVYEFLSRPRPCVFLNVGGASWRNDPNFACWRLGEVADGIDDLLATVRKAQGNHAAVLPAQREAVRGALGDDWNAAPVRAAALIRDFLLRTLL
jgi:hypothetical protein